MNVSIHARGQLLGRMPAPEAVAIIAELEAARPPKSKQARIIRRFGAQRSDGQSNGDVLVAIIEKGTVVTCYWRRGTQSFDAESFRCESFRDMTRTEAEQAAYDRVRYEQTIKSLRKALGAH